MPTIVATQATAGRPVIERDRLDHLLRTLFADLSISEFGCAIHPAGVASHELCDGVFLDTEDAATVLRIISGEDFAPAKVVPQPGTWPIIQDQRWNPNQVTCATSPDSP